MEIITESKQEEGRFGSSIKMILSGKGLKSPVKGTREEV
ncbi:hypothetical protein OVS_02240 [Mycoplasma ovis str. Michigan]|uniref:Uncharacterized protein n=1 Tax=Mycoplasma ovis str. Michigan TaxID=1415773 RepID=A0ABM5P1S5_9MOLU|nr:hypothetical protein OVS_02240 [Mycoplasma ovis str. Michigan]